MRVAHVLPAALAIACALPGFHKVTESGSSPAPASCKDSSRAGGGSDCGVSHDVDCCARPLVPGGTFARSFDAVTFTNPENPATVSPFRMDRFEVTVGRFRAFVDAGMGVQSSAPTEGAGAARGAPDSGWRASYTALLATDKASLVAALDNCGDPRKTWTDAPATPDGERLAMNCVNWGEALAFCIWDGGRLPSEAEWMFAAAGGNEQRVFPWSVPPTSQIVDTQHAEYGCDTNGQCVGRVVTQVGSKDPLGQGKWGHSDLAGNVEEWVLDQRYLEPDPTVFKNPCNDCVDTTDSTARVHHGGSFGSVGDAELRVAARSANGPQLRAIQIGLRCVRDP